MVAGLARDSFREKGSLRGGGFFCRPSRLIVGSFPGQPPHIFQRKPPKDIDTVSTIEEDEHMTHTETSTNTPTTFTLGAYVECRFISPTGRPGRILSCNLNPASVTGGVVDFQIHLADGRWNSDSLSVRRFTDRFGFTPAERNYRS